MSTRTKNRDITRVPKDWLLAPIFSPKQQKKPRSVKVGESVWHMGVPNPLAQRNGEHMPSEPIDMGHVRLLFGLLSFWAGSNPIAVSMSELAHRISDGKGGRYFADLRSKLNDLRNYWISLERPDGTRTTFAALHSIAVQDNPSRDKDKDRSEIWITGVTLYPEFADMLNQVAQLALVRLDVFRSLTSSIAQALYLFIPSRAHHHTKEKPWAITTKLLWEQLGLDPISKSVRKKILTQNKQSVLSQLDGVETRNGKLRVALTETVDGKDYKLLAWQESESQRLLFPESNSPGLLHSWRESGRTLKDFQNKLSTKDGLLNDYEEGKLQSMNIDSDNPFWSLSKKLIGEKFEMIVGQLAMEVAEGKGPKTPSKALNWRLRKEIARQRKSLVK